MKLGGIHYRRSADRRKGSTDNYGYDPSNRRVWKNTSQGERTYFYGVDGTRMGTYSGRSGGLFGGTWDNINLYFAGKLVWQEYTDGVGPGGVVVDRLGSVVVSPPFSPKLFPHGEEASTTQQDRTKYATYYRDATTALDYANQRYCGRTIGRFLTADPYGGSANPANPQSWNRYAYVENDPVNFNDPGGLFIEAPGLYQPEPTANDWDTFNPLIALASLYYGFDIGFSVATPAGIGLAKDGLSTISRGDFKSKKPCNDFFEALIKTQPGLDITASALMNRVALGAVDAKTFVYDGEASKTALDPYNLPGANADGAATVQEWFEQDSTRQALSQPTGWAIWIRAGKWVGGWSPFLTWSGGQASQYGLGTLMHELLHKNMIGGALIMAS